MALATAFVNKLLYWQHCYSIISPLLCKDDNLIIKLYQKESSYFDEEWRFIGIFQVGNVPGMKNVLALFTYKLHNELKSYLCT